MDERAKNLVLQYIVAELGIDDFTATTSFDIYIVWKAKVLQNWKYLISTTLEDKMYYELTYDGDKKCWYFDAYKKVKNRTIATMTYNKETGFDEVTADPAVLKEAVKERS